MTAFKLSNPFLAFMALVLLTACGGSSHYYVLSVASQPTSVYAQKNKVIAVEKVQVPAYLFKREIAVANTTSQITLLGSAEWGEDLDEGLTNRLIGFLQKKFNQPSVYAYPWGLDQQPDIKISVHISRFIAQGSVVHLDASWRLENLKNGKHREKLFATTVNTATDATSIVHAMDRAFSRFEESIAQGVQRF